MLKLTRAQQVRLADLADGAILRTLAGEAGVPGATNLVEAIGATVSTALPATGDAWQGVLRPLGMRVNVIGVFSFGCPKVEFIDHGVAQRCNIGSVLAIVDDLTGPVVDRRALLLSFRPRGDSSPPAQRRFYEEWPPFRLVDGSSGDDWRDLRGSETLLGGCFAEIDFSGDELNWSLRDMSGGPKAHWQGSLGAALAAMTAGACGRKARVGGSDAWSKTVGELLNRTASATIGGLGTQPRVRSATTYMGESGSGLVVFENRKEATLEAGLAKAVAGGDDLPEGPLSIVHVILRSGRLLDS